MILIEFKYEFFIDDERVLEEILHAAQDIKYGHEMMRCSIKNIEFEVRVLRDIWELRRAMIRTQPPATYYDLRGNKSDEYHMWLIILSFQDLRFKDIPDFNVWADRWYEPLYDGHYLPFNPDFNPSFLKSFAGR